MSADILLMFCTEMLVLFGGLEHPNLCENVCYGKHNQGFLWYLYSIYSITTSVYMVHIFGSEVEPHPLYQFGT